MTEISKEIERRIRKVGRYHLYLFLLPVASLLFYGWLRAPHLNERPDNPQRVAPLRARGRILDAYGKPLAQTLENSRVYPQGESSGSLVGYQLRGRNQSGLEAALQSRLSPPLPPSGLLAALQQDREVSSGEHQRLLGPDITLTLDTEYQARLYQALGPEAGAVVVSDKEGRILAAVSSPSFDPNLVGENWQKLRSDPRSPFIERVGSGLYPVVLPTREPLIEQSESAGHPWFGKEPFTGFPASSAALWIQGRLFLTPLMLLEFAFFQSGVEPAPTLHILEETPSPESRTLDFTSLTPSLQSEGVTAWELDGPPFRESPRFLALVGNVEQRLYFAVVVEEADQKARDTVFERVVPAIREGR